MHSYCELRLCEHLDFSLSAQLDERFPEMVTVETTRFAHLKLDSPTLISITFFLIEIENFKNLSSIQTIIAPSNEGYMKKSKHRGYSISTWASN